MSREKKLKRGLKDISPLFSKEKSKAGMQPTEKQQVSPPSDLPRPVVERRESFPQRPVVVPNVQVQCLSVYSPEVAEDSLFIATYLGSRIASQSQPCTILSLGNHPAIQTSNTGPSGLRHLSISWPEWDRVLEESSQTAQTEVASTVLFLDMDIKNVPVYPKVASLLDRWILCLQPNLESVQDCYKFMKATLPHNPRAEFCLLVDTPDQEKGSSLFEKFSELTSKWLGVHLVWLGCFSMGQARSPAVNEQTLEHLFLKSMVFEESLEKHALARFSEELLAGKLRVAV